MPYTSCSSASATNELFLDAVHITSRYVAVPACAVTYINTHIQTQDMKTKNPLTDCTTISSGEALHYD